MHRFAKKSRGSKNLKKKRESLSCVKGKKKKGLGKMNPAKTAEKEKKDHSRAEVQGEWKKQKMVLFG